MEQLSDYEYDLPPELLATEPAEQRESARLLVLDRQTGSIEHRLIVDLPELLSPGDCLIFNDTRVLSARVFGIREATGGKWEGLFLGVAEDGTWRMMGQTRGRLQSDEWIRIHRAHAPESGEFLRLQLVAREPEGVVRMRVEQPGDPESLLTHFGTLPLPPYIKRPLASEQDRERYQTTFARTPGAIAAPTAGLHFTPQLIDACEQRGVRHAFVTLHVGIGTFRPISVEHLGEHRMHSEWCEQPQATADLMNRTQAAGGRVVAVGTTSVRTLESAACSGTGAWSGETDLFIRPPYEFRRIDALITNFHLPKSSLLVLVSALAGRERILAAYEEAIRNRYRFFSYGDAMFIR